MKLVEIRIGRNLPTGGELSRVEWAKFQQEAYNLIHDNYIWSHTVRGENAWIEVHEGRTEWDGRSEDSTVITGYYPESAKLPSYTDSYFLESCRWLADKYKQHSVAVIHGSSVLAESADIQDKKQY